MGMKDGSGEARKVDIIEGWCGADVINQVVFVQGSKNSNIDLDFGLSLPS